LELVAAVAVQPAAAMLASTMFGLAQKQQDKHHDHHCLLVTPERVASKFEPPREEKKTLEIFNMVSHPLPLQPTTVEAVASL